MLSKLHNFLPEMQQANQQLAVQMEVRTRSSRERHVCAPPWMPAELCVHAGGKPWQAYGPGYYMCASWVGAPVMRCQWATRALHTGPSCLAQTCLCLPVLRLSS